MTIANNLFAQRHDTVEECTVIIKDVNNWGGEEAALRRRRLVKEWRQREAEQEPQRLAAEERRLVPIFNEPRQ